jgi:hypothetical protein
MLRFGVEYSIRSFGHVGEVYIIISWIGVLGCIANKEFGYFGSKLIGNIQ